MMSTEFLLPPLPLGGAEYTIVRWLKRAGDAVAAGDPLLVVLNDRIEAALPATSAGTLDQLLVAEGALAVAGAPAVIIAPTSSASPAGVPDAAPTSPRITPLARNIANRHQVDITILHGTGVSGWITKSDILAALSPSAPSLDRFQPPSPIFHPPSPIPYVLTAIDVDLERVAMLIGEQGTSFARRKLDLSYRACVAQAAVAALAHYPLLNSYWADTMIVLRWRVHLAVLPSAGAPPCSIPNAQDLNLRGLVRALGGSDAQRGDTRPTFMIVDLGDNRWGDPAVLPGGAAALGIGALRARPLVIDDGGVDRLAARRGALLTLAYDARVLDQPYADAFLRDVKCRLEYFHI